MSITLLQGDCREVLTGLPERGVQCCVTSPPYFGLRRYDVDGAQIGMEQTPADYVAALVDVFREVRRVLRDDGTLWVNLGDSYVNNGFGRHDDGRTNDPSCGKNEKWLGQSPRSERRRTLGYGLPQKNLLGIPWRVAFALQDDGWILRSDIIWSKPNPMPESVTDRPTRAHEYLFLFAKQARYFYDADAIKESSVNGDPSEPRGSRGSLSPNAGRRDKQGESGLRRYVGFNARWSERVEPLTVRNRRSVWTVSTRPFSGAHFAVFPEQLIEPCILAGSRPGDIVLDPFVGSGTTCRVAERYGRDSIGIDLGYQDLQEKRTDGVQRAMVDLF